MQHLVLDIARVGVSRAPRAQRLEFPRLLDRRAQRTKRAVDLAIGALLSVAAVPVGLLIAFAIIVESGGPVFYAHERIGRGGRRFPVWKFRSMVADGDDVLAHYLAAHPDRALEWEFTHKLKDDPRITRVGRFLRRSSLDELPQLWNIFRGEMSMVGPRPIVDDELPKYGPGLALYTQVAPGLTGLWQVSGRNDTSYRRRVELDTAYVRNWTAALDLRLLLRTVRVVLAGKGAY